jgi:hypothetical protein
VYNPGTKTQAQNESPITCVQWNRKVQHVRFLSSSPLSIPNLPVLISLLQRCRFSVQQIMLGLQLCGIWGPSELFSPSAIQIRKSDVERWLGTPMKYNKNTHTHTHAHCKLSLFLIPFSYFTGHATGHCFGGRWLPSHSSVGSAKRLHSNESMHFHSCSPSFLNLSIDVCAVFFFFPLILDAQRTRQRNLVVVVVSDGQRFAAFLRKGQPHTLLERQNIRNSERSRIQQPKLEFWCPMVPSRSRHSFHLLSWRNSKHTLAQPTFFINRPFSLFLSHR